MKSSRLRLPFLRLYTFPSKLGSVPYRHFPRTPHILRSVLRLITMMIPRCPRVPSVLGSSERSSLWPGMSILFFVHRRMLGTPIHPLIDRGTVHLSMSSSAPAYPAFLSQSMLLSCSPSPLANSWKQSSQPGSSPPLVICGASTLGSSIARNTWWLLL